MQRNLYSLKIFFCRAISVSALTLGGVILSPFYAGAAAEEKGPSPISEDQNHQKRPLSTNVLVRFFEDCEPQAEDKEQAREILRALEDMMTKSVKQLKKVRYKDYQGRTKRWTLVQLIQRYHSSPVLFSEEEFYRDVKKPEAQAVIKKHAIELHITLGEAAH